MQSKIKIWHKTQIFVVNFFTETEEKVEPYSAHVKKAQESISDFIILLLQFLQFYYQFDNKLLLPVKKSAL